jgi:hypothetical protein
MGSFGILGSLISLHGLTTMIAPLASVANLAWHLRLPPRSEIGWKRVAPAGTAPASNPGHHSILLSVLSTLSYWTVGVSARVSLRPAARDSTWLLTSRTDDPRLDGPNPARSTAASVRRPGRCHRRRRETTLAISPGAVPWRRSPRERYCTRYRRGNTGVGVSQRLYGVSGAVQR